MGAPPPPPPTQLGFTDKGLSPSETSARHNPSEPNGSDAVSVPIIKSPITMGAAILPLPPTKGTTVRQSMRGVAFTKARALSEPSARPHVSTLPAGAQGPPARVCYEHLEWIEQEVARRVAAALALSKDENAPAASAGAPYKDAGTQVDAVIPTARASGAEDDRVLIEKKVLAPSKLSVSLSYSPFPKIKWRGKEKNEKKNPLFKQLADHFREKKKKIQTVNKPSDKPVKGVDKELPTTASEQAVPSLERKAAKSAEQAMQHVGEPRNGRPLQLKIQHHQLKSDNRRPQPQNRKPPVDPKPAFKKVQNTAPAAATGSRASAAPKAINPIKNQASKPASKKISRPLVPNWFQMLQPPPKKQS